MPPWVLPRKLVPLGVSVVWLSAVLKPTTSTATTPSKGEPLLLHATEVEAGAAPL